MRLFIKSSYFVDQLQCCYDAWVVSLTSKVGTIMGNATGNRKSLVNYN